MNEEYRDTEEVLMIVKKATMFADPIMKISSIGLAKLVQFFARMVKEKVLDKREFKDFQDFAKRTEGNFDVINVPVEHKIGFGADASVVREFADLKENGVRFYEMPDLNMDDHYVQLAVSREDKEIFSAWYGRYLKNRMSGGEKTADSLDAFTDGNTSIFNVPLEGKEEVFREDFSVLKINYTVLPDLKIGDGQIQIMVANSDVPKVEQWYQLYRKDLLDHGEEIPDLNPIDMNTYQKSGEMSTEEYINTGDAKVDAVNQKYEKENVSAYKVQLAADKKGYADYESDQMYQKFTINASTLVNPLKEDNLVKNLIEEWDKKGLFISRIPGTYGENKKYLLIPKEYVFLSDDQKTYTAFLEKNIKPLVVDRNFSLVAGVDQRLYTSELFRKHYALSEKELAATDTAQHKIVKIAEKTSRRKPMKAPNPPLKSK